MCESYASDLVKVVVAQIAQGMGFHSIQQSACDTLADILQMCMSFILLILPDSANFIS